MTFLKFKRFTALLLSATLVFSLSACLGGEDNPPETTPSESTVAPTVPVETTSPVEPTDTVPTEVTEPSTEPTIAPTEPTEPKTGLFGTVTANQLNIRSKASSTSDVVGVLKKGNKVQITETKTAGGYEWGRIENGWIALKYVKVESGTIDTDKVIGSGIIGTVTTDGLRIRSSATTDSNSKGELTKGQRIGFDKFTHNGSAIWGHFTKGWVSLNYIDLETGYKAGSTLTGSVTSNDLRVRTGPGTENDIVTTLPKGKEVTISDFYSIGKTVWGYMGQGWLSLEYVDFDCGITLSPGTNEKVVSEGGVGGSWMYINADYLSSHTPNVSTLLLASDGSFYFGSCEYRYSTGKGWYGASGGAGCYGNYTYKNGALTTVTTSDDYEGVMNKYSKPVTDKTTISVSGNCMTIYDGDSSYFFMRTSSVYEYVAELIKRNPGNIDSSIVGTWENGKQTTNGWKPGGNMVFNADNTFSQTVVEYTFSASKGWTASSDPLTYKGLYIFNGSKLTLIYQTLTYDATGETASSEKLVYISNVEISGDTMTCGEDTYKK
ncbi:MAG: SH3 domain-containing protein [Oscillospiraceae bacterium]|nr:SH3 domain-containing protein [Oscillospiraceae bacterium]